MAHNDLNFSIQNLVSATPHTYLEERVSYKALYLRAGEGFNLFVICGRPTLALSSALVPQTLSCLVCVEDS